MKTIEYTVGRLNYKEYLTVGNIIGNAKVIKVKKTNYGYLFEAFNNYVTLFYGKLIINPNGTAKLRMKVKRNYCADYQYTVYFNTSGFEIQCEDHNTRKELQVYNELNKQTNGK
jgi:hypothetical protein